MYFDFSCPDLVSDLRLRRALERFGAGRLILGSDAPFGQDNLARGIARIRSLDISEIDEELILGGNLERLLGVTPGEAGMVTSLRPVAEEDRARIERWAGFAAGYMSRTHPLDAAADRHAPASGLYWYVIVADGRDVGTVWVELPPGAGEAVLGVFLCDASHLGRGIGTAAVELALAEFRHAHPGMQVALRVRRTNARAIACYRRVGFTVTGSGAKSLPSGEAVPYCSMVLPRG